MSLLRAVQFGGEGANGAPFPLFFEVGRVQQLACEHIQTRIQTRKRSGRGAAVPLVVEEQGTAQGTEKPEQRPVCQCTGRALLGLLITAACLHNHRTHPARRNYAKQ